MTFKRLQLTVTPRLVAPQFDDEAIWYAVCEVCGQAYDARIFDAVIYHSQPEHQPIRLNS